MRGHKPTLTTLSVLAVSALTASQSSVFAATTEAATAVASTPEVMQASGGLTLGSAALIALAGVVVTFGKSGVTEGAVSQHDDNNEFGKHRSATPSRLSGDQQ